MDKTYVYTDHSGMDFYLSDRLRTAEELYCLVCACSDQLIGVYEDEEALAAALTELFKAGYDLLPCSNYSEIKNKYCPPEFRAWEKDSEITSEDPQMRSDAESLSSVINDITQNKGLVGIFSRPGAGKTALLMYILSKLSQYKQERILILSLEQSKAQWKQKSSHLNLSADNAVICDDTKWSTEKLKNVICSHRCTVVALDYLQLTDFDLKTIKDLSEKLSVPFIVTGYLSAGAENFDTSRCLQYLEICDCVIHLQQMIVPAPKTTGECRKVTQLTVRKNNWGELHSFDFDCISNYIP